MKFLIHSEIFLHFAGLQLNHAPSKISFAFLRYFRAKTLLIEHILFLADFLQHPRRYQLLLIGGITLPKFSQIKINLHLLIYFSIVRLNAACASFDNLSTSFIIITLKAF